MSTSVKIEKVTAVTSNGPKTLYNVEATDDKTGKTLSKTTVDDQAQAEYLAEHLDTLHNNQPHTPAGTGPDSEPPVGEDSPTPDTPLDNDPPPTPEASGPRGTETGIPESTADPYQPGATAKSPTPGSLTSSSTLTKKARDLCGMANERKKEFNKLTETQLAEQKINGVFGNKRVQSMANRKKAASEVIVGRGVDNNAFIVIGNDRPGKLHEGYGGKGHTQCDSIDLVAGLGGPCVQEVEKHKTSTLDGEEVLEELKTVTNPNFFVDAARIYISQKTDVDKNFGLREFGPSKSKDKDKPMDPKEIGKYGAKSAVVAKADNVRVIARESLQLVTGTDKKNSQGGYVLGKTGIEIVAMNDYEKLQPMVLGDNLVKFLEEMIKRIDALTKISHAAGKYQMKLNQAIQHHTHHSPFFGIPTLPSEVCMAAGVECDLAQTMKTEMSSLKQLTNLTNLRMNYLLDSGDNYINSELNKCN